MKLFERITIKSMRLKNRVVLAPMGTTTDHTYGFNERDVAYYGERAKGGVGLVLTGAVVASEEFEPAPCQKLITVKDVYRLRQVAERVHAHDARFGIQLSPGIGRMNWIDPTTAPYSASPCPNYYNPDLTCRELPLEGVRRLVRAMGSSARLAAGAGVDIIEIHAYGGYLIDQFNSSCWNRRTDAYGGSFENRTRFMMEIIEEVRRTVGPSFPIAVKMTLDSVDDPERPLEEGIAIARLLAESGLVDLIHFGRGAYSCRWRMVSSVYQPEGFDLEAARLVREVTGDVPVMAHGKLNHAEVAERALADGLVDLVAIGHGLIADPHWANKVREGREDEICPCIGCGECHLNSMRGWPRPCAVNPTSMHEGEYVLTPVAEPRRILVIGGGPGGMKAAATAAERGFDVTLMERRGYLGGAMAAAGAMPFKRDVRDQVDYLIRRLGASGARVVCGRKATLDDVLALDPHLTVVATGAEPIVPRVPGADVLNVRLAIPVLMGEQEVWGRVVVVGGGDVGCELSVELSRRGHAVTIVEMSDAPLARGGSFVANEQHLRRLVADSGAEAVCGARPTAIEGGCVRVLACGVERTIPADTVVLACGYRADQSLYEQILDAGLACVQVGDNVRPRKIIDAISEGYNYMRVLE